VLGAGPWQLTTVQLAQAMGYQVLVTDLYRDRPAYEVADDHAVIDIVDRNATLAIARRKSIQGILCDTTDVGVATAAFVAEQLGLPGLRLDAALNFCDKIRMRDKCAEAGIPGPRYRRVRSLGEVNAAAMLVGLPAVVKPADNQSGRGVVRVETLDALYGAVTAALALSRSGSVVIEKFIGGQEFIVDSFTTEAGTEVLGVARKIQYPDNLTVSARIDYSPQGDSQIREKLIGMHVRTLRVLGLENGVAHAEYMIKGDDVIPLDVAARGGGVNIYTHVIPGISGVNVNRAMIAYAMGDSVHVTPRTVRGAACVRFFRMPAGKFVDIQGEDAARKSPGIALVHLNMKVGDTVGALSDKDARPGYVIALGEILSEAQSNAEAAVNCIRVRIGQSDRFVAVI